MEHKAIATIGSGAGIVLDLALDIRPCFLAGIVEPSHT
jgi:hypothetical protein